jgi:uncharacterized protein YnzC (UPF0291/DUF896 family)
MSGLQINVEKTKALWFGSMIGSETKLCNDVALDWTREPIKILGVNFSADVSKIWELNSNEIKTKCEHTFNTWSKRNLTLFGKITVIKSLIISRFVHLFISLPNPPADLLTYIEQNCYKFLWNNGPDKIKRTQSVRNIEIGGLGMTDLKSFIYSLKLSWLKKLVTSKCETWKTLANFDSNEILTLGTDFTQKKIKELKNPFWKNVLEGWNLFCKKLKFNDINSIIFSPLWYNHNFANQSLFYKNWFEKHIEVLIDIIDDNGNFYTFNQLKDIYNINGTFLDYQRLLMGIPNEWKSIIRNNNTDFKMLKGNMHLNTHVKFIIKQTKGCKEFYEVLSDQQNTYESKKWESIFGILNHNEFKTMYKNLLEIEEIKLKDFQFKINNKILVTKSFLYKINKVQSNMCSYCNESPETIYHLFCECCHVKLFITTIKQWTSTRFHIKLPDLDKVFLLHSQNECYITNYITILVKYFIYKSKFRDHCRSFLTISNFKIYLKYKLLSRKYILCINKRNENLQAVLSNILETLENGNA